jgi:hypothetical protein
VIDHLSTAMRSIIVASTAMILSACLTGERPSFVEADAAAAPADPVVAEVTALLVDGPQADQPVVARYDVLRKFGNTSTEVVLAREGDRWSLTVGDVRYLEVAGDRSTCELSTGRCERGFDEARVSDVLTTVRFSDAAATTRLRRDSETATGAAERSTRLSAGRSATCALVPQPGGNSLYCANHLGLLAIQDTADVRISLISIDEAVDPSFHATTGRPSD